MYQRYQYVFSKFVKIFVENEIIEDGVKNFVRDFRCLSMASALSFEKTPSGIIQQESKRIEEKIRHIKNAQR